MLFLEDREESIDGGLAAELFVATCCAAVVSCLLSACTVSSVSSWGLSFCGGRIVLRYVKLDDENPKLIIFHTKYNRVMT